MSDETVLSISNIGIVPYSARGLTQTLTPIPASVSMERTVNGNLIDISAPQFQKYRTTISGNDQLPPALDGVWPGKTIVVDCITEIAYESTAPARTEVPGSIRSDGGFTIYRPRLTMLVTGFDIERDEWGAVVGWQLDAEEV